jgi:hypothetical protein
MKCSKGIVVFVVSVFGFLGFAASPSASAQAKKPNILVIMGDDIGWFNLGSYNQGIMLDTTPNLDKLAADGMGSPTTTLNQVAPQAAPTSLPANYRFAPG